MISRLAISDNQLLFSCISRNGWGYLFNSKNIKKSYQILKWQTYNYASKISLGIQFTQDSQKIITFEIKYLKIWGIESRKEIKLIRRIQTNRAFYLSEPLLTLKGRFILDYQDNQFSFWDIETGEIYEHSVQLGNCAYIITKDVKYIVIRKFIPKVLIYKRKET